MDTNTKDVVIKMAKQFYDTKFDEFNDSSLSETMTATFEQGDEAFSNNILVKITNVVFNDNTEEELAKRLPDVSKQERDEAQRALHKHIVMAAVSIYLTRTIASITYSVFGNYAADMGSTGDFSEERISHASSVISRLITESIKNGVDIGLEHAMETTQMLAEHLGQATKH
jgi:uncharacterized membrane protein YgcG